MGLALAITFGVTTGLVWREWGGPWAFLYFVVILVVIAIGSALRDAPTMDDDLSDLDRRDGLG